MSHDSAPVLLRQRPKRHFAPRTGQNAACGHPQPGDSHWALSRCHGAHAGEEWHTHPAARMINAGGGSRGVWVLRWISLAVENRLEALLLSWIVGYWFGCRSDHSVRNVHGKRRQVNKPYRLAKSQDKIRAGFFMPLSDQQGNPLYAKVRFLATSAIRLGRELAMDRKTVGRCLKRLEKAGYIQVFGNPIGPGIIIRLCGRKLTEAYCNFGNDDQYSAGLTMVGGEANKIEYQWTETEIGRRAVNRDHRDLMPKLPEDNIFTHSGIGDQTWQGCDDTVAYRRPICRGTFLHDLIYIACGKRMGAAMLMAQLLWWFSLGKNGKPRARLVRDGHRWLFKSLKQWGREIGGDRSNISSCIDHLVEQKFFIKRVWRYKGRRVIHLSPNCAVIEAAFRQATAEANRLAEDRFRDQRSALEDEDESAA